MFNKVLVANRGEIAVRIIRTLKEMGIKSVAVYSEVDSHSLHVQLADESYALGGRSSAESYLNTEKILEILKVSEADALHPGYGFYSENADFAEAIAASGVTFIGPPPEAIRIMGDKISSRHAAESAGVSGVPGKNDVVSSPEQVIAFGEEFGWPVAIKAAYGGGGKGMKVVYRKEDAKEALETAMREAKASFGRDEAYLEKYLDWPRHIEMQIFADIHGNAVYLGERDCSIQRRHQKLIEESPAPNFPDDILHSMGLAAVKVAKACNYVNAGTVEFLYQDGQFYFLEMNTRLQVEHPVTELVVGKDLVKLQLQIASGMPIPFTQDEVNKGKRGHAIECRINAEDPAGGKFLPSPGPIKVMEPPAGYGVRLDSGFRSGDTVSEYYDNLIAKLIVYGENREEAISRMIRALKEFKIEGIPTTMPAQIAVLEHSDFQQTKHSTRWLEDSMDLSFIEPSPPLGKFEEDDIEPTVVKAEVNGKTFEVKLYLDNQVKLRSPKKKPLVKKSSGTQIGLDSETIITAPMQGTVVKVMVELGQEVENGQPVCVLEAMKMENVIYAKSSGSVKQIFIKPGQKVMPYESLLEIA